MFDYNILAEQMLGALGIVKPTDEQVNFMASVILYQANVSKKKIMCREGLSPREYLCLYLSARGKSSDEMAEIMNLKKSTVHSHKKHILRKMSCVNMTEAVFRGVQWGLI